MWSFEVSLFVFILSMGMVAFTGVKLTASADRLADVTGLGEALMGAVILGFVTSLSGSVLSLTTALENHPQFAIDNAIGGIGIQLLFLAVADITYSRSNLEHAAASQENLMQCVLLMIILLLPLLAKNGPEIRWGWVHPVTLLIFPVYLTGLKIIRSSQKSPMWKPSLTRETVVDKPGKEKIKKSDYLKLWIWFLVLCPVIAVAGWALGRSGIAIAHYARLSETFVGGFVTAGITSVPELVITLAAVRRGALTLAVGNIIGGNTFDTLIVAGSDLTYTKGSIYHAMGGDQTYLIALTLLLTAILMMGLLKREKHGIANIGMESLLVILVYLGGFAFLIWGGR